MSNEPKAPPPGEPGVIRFYADGSAWENDADGVPRLLDGPDGPLAEVRDIRERRDRRRSE